MDALAGRWAVNLRWVAATDAPGEPLRAGSRTTGPDHGPLGLEGRRRKAYAEGGEAGARTKGSTRPAVNSGSSRSSGCGRRRFPGPPRVFSPSSNAARIRGWSPTDGVGGRCRGGPRFAPGGPGASVGPSHGTEGTPLAAGRSVTFDQNCGIRNTAQNWINGYGYGANGAVALFGYWQDTWITSAYNYWCA